jgi:hypothetical protein
MQCSGASAARETPDNATTDKVEIDPQRMAIAAGQASELLKTLGHKDRLMVLCHLGAIAGHLPVAAIPAPGQDAQGIAGRDAA